MDGHDVVVVTDGDGKNYGYDGDVEEGKDRGLLRMTTTEEYPR